MHSLTFRKANAYYFLFFMYFTIGSACLVFVPQSTFIILNEVLLVAPPALYIAHRCRGELSFREFIRLNPVKFKTVILSLILAICSYPVLMVLNLAVLYILPSPPASLDNAVLVSSTSFVAGIFGIGMFPGVFEEITFRGVFMRGVESKGKVFAILYTSLLFALMHMNPYNFIMPFAIGVLLGYLLFLTNSIIPGMIVHIVVNSITVVSVPLLSSAHGSEASSVATTPSLSIMVVIILLTLVFIVILPLLFICKILRAIGNVSAREDGKTRTQKEQLTREEKRSVWFITPQVVIVLGTVIYMIAKYH